MTRFVLFAVIVPFLVPVAQGHAQTRGSWEFGIDAGFNLSILDEQDNILTFGLPATDFGSFLQNLRIGYFTSETFEIESSIGLSYLSQSNAKFWRLGLTMEGVYNFPRGSDPSDENAIPFLRGGGILTVWGDDDETLTQLGLGLGVGTKLPLGSQWALRLEIGGARYFENDDFLSHWDVNGSVGFSFFTM